jgi:hypothetical protein
MLYPSSLCSEEYYRQNKQLQKAPPFPEPKLSIYFFPLIPDKMNQNIQTTIGLRNKQNQPIATRTGTHAISGVWS